MNTLFGPEKFESLLYIEFWGVYGGIKMALSFLFDLKLWLGDFFKLNPYSLKEFIITEIKQNQRIMLT